MKARMGIGSWLAVLAVMVPAAAAAEWDRALLRVIDPQGEPAPAAVDNRLGTAWVSATAQRPGMTVTIDLGATGVIQRVFLTPGEHRSAYPRALRVWAGLSPDHLRIVHTQELTLQVDTDLRFAPTPAAWMRLEIGGEGAGYPWAIAELAVFGSRAPDAWPPRQAVLLPGDAMPLLRQASEELAYYVGELTGQATPLWTPDAIPPDWTGRRFVLDPPTPPAHYDAAYLESDAFRHPERFRVTLEEDAIIFRGETPLGLLYGVYEFLHRQGVRWLYPDALGDFVPAPRPLDLAGLPLEDEPAFAWRYANWNSERQQDRPDEYRWYYRNRWNGTWAGALNDRPGVPQPAAIPHFGYTHTFATLVPKERFNDRPDWFPQMWHPSWIPRIGLLNLGRRIPYETTWGLNFCTSNPEVIAHIADRVRRRTDPPDARALVWLTPMDAGSFCECRECRALDNPSQSPPPYWNVPQALSNRYFTFILAVAERLREAVPGVRVGAFAYEGYLPPPERYPRLPANVVVDVVQYGAYNLPLSAPTNAPMRAYLEGWAQRWTEPGGLGIYDWALLTAGAGGWPIPLVTALSDRIATFHRLGARRLGTQANATPEFWRLNPWNYYAYSRLAWNPEEPAGTLLDDFFNGYYREAAASMRAYYTTWESYLLTHGIALGQDCRYTPPPTLPTPLLAAMQDHLHAALRTAEHWLVRQRIADAIEGYQRLTARVTVQADR